MAAALANRASVDTNNGATGNGAMLPKRLSLAEWGSPTLNLRFQRLSHLVIRKSESEVVPADLQENDYMSEDSQDDGFKEELHDHLQSQAFGGLDPRAAGQQQVNIVDNEIFTFCMGGAVMLNLVTIGFETDVTDQTSKEVFATINTSFLLGYIAELVMRLLTHGPEALRDVLTVMDLFLVTTSFIERLITNSGFSRALPAFRLLRVLRLTKQIKALRRQRELWILVASAKQVIVTICWVTLLTFAPILAVSGMTKVTIGDSAAWVGTMDPMVPHEPFEPFDNNEYFGSAFRSFLTLMQVVTASQWADVGRRVMRVYPIAFLFFFSFIFMTTYGVVNCVISNMVQASVHISSITEEEIAEFDRQTRQQIGDQVLHVLRLVDRDGDGIVQPEEIDRALRKTDLPLLLADLNVPAFNGTDLFRIFDKVGNGIVRNEEIVDGLIRFDDDLKAKDYVRLNLWARNCLLRASMLGDKVGGLSAKCHDLRLSLEKAMEAMEYFQGTKEVTELRFNAIKAIRSAPPEEVPKLVGWKPPPVPKFPPENESQLYIGFATKVLGGRGPFCQPPEDDGHGPRNAARRGELPPAPPRAEIAKQLMKEAAKPFEDKYAMEPDPARHNMPGPSKGLRTLRELIQ